MQIPDTEFAHCGDIQIAYQVYGSGPAEVVICGGPAGHIEVYWEQPLVHRWYERIGAFARVALFDRRGTGASDSGEGPPTDAQYMEDLAAVIEAIGFERPALVGAVEAARMCALFASTYPERVSALVLIDTAAAGRHVLGDEQARWLAELIDARWGKGETAALYAPSMANDEGFKRWFSRLERHSVSPRSARQIVSLALESDVTEALPNVQCSTLVLHHRENALVPVALGRAVADAIPDARFVEVRGMDSMAWLGDADALIAEIEEFLTGSRTPVPCSSELAAILFTDIVGSTELAARLHDEQWQMLLDAHDQAVRREVELCGGRTVKTIGDGFLAIFPTPDRAVRAADQAIRATHALGVELRAGIHVGVVEKLANDVRGIAVHIAARISQLAGATQVLVSGTVHDILIGSELELTPLPPRRLRGVPGQWRIYQLQAPDTRAERGHRAEDGVIRATAPESVRRPGQAHHPPAALD